MNGAISNKYSLRYFGKRSCMHLKTKIHLFLFLIVFNKGHPNIVIASLSCVTSLWHEQLGFVIVANLAESSPHAASA